MLTPREAEIAGHLVADLGDKQIGLSPRTVEKHVERLRRRLGAANRLQAVALLRAELPRP